MTQDQTCFERLAETGEGDAADLARLIRGGDLSATRDLAALWLHAAAARPEHLARVYDASAEGWLGARPAAPPLALDSPPLPIPPAFWEAFWALALSTETGLDAGLITQRTAALAGQTDPGMRLRSAAAAMAYPGVSQSAAKGYPERFTLEGLAMAPKGSLGAEFHDLIVDNGFDLEVLDRDALGLADLPPPLDYLNARILQCHDLWHIVGGYRTTGLHEVAISGFQAAQFGHGYSAMFLAMVLSKVAFAESPGANMLLDVILSAWTHGRESPSLMGLDWPQIWDRTVADIRAEVGITPFTSPYPADLFEMMRAA